MQPNILSINNSNYRVYTDEIGINYPASPIPIFALRRVFNLAVNSPKIVHFQDLSGFWLIDSCYISSPEDSEITFQILDSNGISFYQDTLLRSETPKTFPSVLITNTLTLKLTAAKSNINLALIYLKPAHLAYSQDF